MDNLPGKKLPVVTIGFDYARLSRDRGKKSENIGIQHRESAYFIEDNEWEHGGSFDDDDISASRFSRKIREGYQALIRAVRNVPDRSGSIVRVVIVVTEMPRLYRRMEELLALIKMANDTALAGIWTTDNEGYDLSTPEGIHRAIGAVNNAMLESNRASKRQLRKKRAQAAQGRYMGGQRRYGFEGALRDEQGNIVNRDRINVAEIPEEIAHWRDWCERLIAGESQSSIVRDNNRRGISAPQGGKWTIGNFKRLILQEAYVVFDAEGHPDDCPCLENPEGNGTLVHKTSGSKHRARWRGLLTPDEHELLRSVLESSSQGWAHGLVYGRQYLLSGIAVCGGTHDGHPCEAPMYGSGRKVASGQYQTRYRCKGVDNHGERIGCGKVFRDAVALEAFVTDAVLDCLDSPEMAEALAPKEDADQAAELTRKIASLRKRRDLLRRQYARGEIEEIDDYKAMRSEVDTAIEELRSELGKLRTSRAATLLPVDGHIREAWEAADLEWRRSVLQLVVKRVIVLPGHPRAAKYRGRVFNTDHVKIEWVV
jgi:site-specific DNA recombinase